VDFQIRYFQEEIHRRSDQREVRYITSDQRDESLTDRSLHWYLAIIYFPEYTLLPPPIQAKNFQPRRSTRRLGVITDFPDAQQPKPAPRQSPSPHPSPPPNGHVDSVVDPETPRTDDPQSEIDVERMVESALTPVEPPSKREQQAGTANADVIVTQCPNSPLLAYPQSSPTFRPTTLLSSDPQGDGTKHAGHVTSAGGNKGDTIPISGISPATFYGTEPQGKGDVTPVTPPAVAPSALPEIEIAEDETVGNPESEPEEAAEYAFFVSGIRELSLMSSKGIQGLTSIRLIHCRRSTLRLSRGSANIFSWRLTTKSS